jgi:hypothetical protein
MTSREHARRLMLILLSSTGSSAPDSGSESDRSGEHHDDRQAGEGRDDSTEGDDRGEKRLLEALMLP